MSDKIKDGGHAFPRSPRSGIYEGEYDGMTLRQYAAIKLRVPNGGTDWLDEMIRQGLRDEFATKALSVLDVHAHVSAPAADILAKSAYNIADAMLKAREAE